MFVTFHNGSIVQIQGPSTPWLHSLSMEVTLRTLENLISHHGVNFLVSFLFHGAKAHHGMVGYRKPGGSVWPTPGLWPGLVGLKASVSASR